MWITPSRLWLDNKSWMNREVHVQFCESVGVKLPCATRPYVKIKGKSAYLYRAVDKEGHTIDFLLTPNRDRDAAETFLQKAIRKGQLLYTGTMPQTPAEQFYALAA